jgi:hypothetical protein
MELLSITPTQAEVQGGVFVSMVSMGNQTCKSMYVSARKREERNEKETTTTQRWVECGRIEKERFFAGFC